VLGLGKTARRQGFEPLWGKADLEDIPETGFVLHKEDPLA